MNWLDIYDEKYFSLLNNAIMPQGKCEKRNCKPGLLDRASGFRLIFEIMLENKNSDFQIIETGTVRNPNNWKDGNSGFLFAEMVKLHKGFVRSVDINQSAVDTANSFIDKNYYRCSCSDSVSWLKSINDLSEVDLFYLDSKDVKWHNDVGSAQHHLNEFLAIEPFIKKGAVVAIDDNVFLLDGQRRGKGRLVYEYLQSKNIMPVYDKYQIIYKW
jgi:hypothetical protein